jgi:hypothetical protein
VAAAAAMLRTWVKLGNSESAEAPVGMRLKPNSTDCEGRAGLAIGETQDLESASMQQAARRAAQIHGMAIGERALLDALERKQGM